MNSPKTIFNRWRVYATYRKNGETWCRCICQCNTRGDIRRASLVAGISRSCGCLRSEMLAERNRNSRKCA